MNFKCFFVVLIALVIVSCTKESAGKKETYIVSASKIIGLTGNTWNNVQPDLNNKDGYEYTLIQDPGNYYIKAAVSVFAIDDSNRNVKGRLLLNTEINDSVVYAGFGADSLSKTDAYAIMLNYNNELLQTLTTISSSWGQVIENGMGSNPHVDVILSKLNSGEDAYNLGITYNTPQGSFTIAIFRNDNDTYNFGCSGRP